MKLNIFIARRMRRRRMRDVRKDRRVVEGNGRRQVEG